MNWVVTVLTGVLAIISVLTIAVLAKVFVASSKIKKNRQTKSQAQSNTQSKNTSSKHAPSRQQPKQPPPKTAPPPEPEPELDNSLARKVLEEEDEDPVAEAEVFLTYGLKDKAIEVLERHLAKSPADEAAKATLEKARQSK